MTLWPKSVELICRVLCLGLLFLLSPVRGAEMPRNFPPYTITAGPAPSGTFIVTNTNDSGAGSLRQALRNADLNFQNVSRVTFNIPGDGVHSIIVPEANPLTVSRPVVIDGFTQPGSKANTLSQGIEAVLHIEVRGQLRIVSDNCTVRGLVINSTGSTALQITGDGNAVEGCFIGTDPTGTVGLGSNSDGVVVNAPRGDKGNRIGGLEPAARNLISGNQRGGITLSASRTPTTIQNNYIGCDVTGRRPIGNALAGVQIFGNEDGSGAAKVGGTQSGEGNLIAFNGIGVYVATGTGHSILANSIFGNLSVGIDLARNDSGFSPETDGPTANDQGDSDIGSNGLQNHPIISSVSTANESTTVQGTLNSKANATYRVEFFANPDPDPQGVGEGQQFLGAQDVTTDANGNASFAASFSGVAPFVSSTATDAAANTSEFSQFLSPPAGAFAAGDIFVSGTHRIVQRLAPDGKLRAVLETGAPEFDTYGMAFDPEGDLYVTGRDTNTVTRFDAQGNSRGTFASGHDGRSWLITFDNEGNAYVANAGGTVPLRKFNRQGNLLQDFNVPLGGAIGQTTFDLAADQRTMFYAVEGRTIFQAVTYENRIRRFDLIANQALPDFVTGLPGNVRGLELLSDGGVLVAIEREILRLNAQGQVVRSYDFFGIDSWSSVVLNADGQGFWAANDGGPWIHRFDLASGEMLQRIFVGEAYELSILVKPGPPALSIGSRTVLNQAAAAPIDVSTTTDSGPGSLRLAIESANATPGLDTITFNIAGAGPHTIKPQTPLPEIVAPMVLDGYSQLGSQVNSSANAALQDIRVVVDGSQAGPLADGLVVAGGGSIVKGLSIVRFSGSGLVLGESGGNAVQGNFVGVEPSGAIAGNQKHGILMLDSWLNEVGTRGGLNLISGNAGAGVAVAGASAGGNVIERNFIGTDRTGLEPRGNGGAGVLVTASENLIGSRASDGNLIAFNRAAGVEVFGSRDFNRFRDWPFQEVIGVRITRNSIHSNAGLGIDLTPPGTNTNDEARGPDDDDGPNNRLNFPLLNAVVAGSQAVTGLLLSTPSFAFEIQVFANPDCDDSSNGEGREFVGGADVSTDAQGRAEFTVALNRSLNEGEFLTAVTLASDDDTSEFSPCLEVSQGSTAPRLEVVLGPNGRVRITWPETAVDFRLETTTSLVPPVSWAIVTPAPVVESGQFILRVNPTEAARFYRLRKP